MMRVLTPLFASGILLRSAGARAEAFSGPGMAEITESLWLPIFSGGIVFGLVVFAALKIWHSIKERRHH